MSTAPRTTRDGLGVGDSGAASHGHNGLRGAASATRPVVPESGGGAAGVESRYFSRDLSWLEFNARVLAQALDERVSLLERVRFLAIFTNNLDEFVQKRVGLLNRLIDAGIQAPFPDGLTPREAFDAVRARILELQHVQAECFETRIRPALGEAGIVLLAYADLTPAERAVVDDWFRVNVYPVLTPLAVDPGHRFPFISNLSENLGVMVSRPDDSERQFARIKIPDVVPRLVRIDDLEGMPKPEGEAASGPTRSRRGDDRVRLVGLDEIIRNNLDDLFPGMVIHDVMAFRVTRSADTRGEDEREVDNLLESVEEELAQRRIAPVLRVELNADPSPKILEVLERELGIEARDVYLRPGPLEYLDLFQIADLDRPDLKDRPWTPITPPRLAEKSASIFDVIRERDVIVHHPYESFQASVEHFIASAARDPDVLAIKQTLYRTSPKSPFIESLIRAAKSGKQVACLVELRARFDEHRNVRFARQLEKAGVHVAYGVVGLKTHCKCSLVVRREQGGVRCYAHVGTGNYHPRTAQLYTDLGLLTCRRDIGDDVVTLFNALTGHAETPVYKKLLVAPQHLRKAFARLIDREIENARAGRPARIVAKMNSLEDKKTADRLYAASQAGVPVELYVRGFCCVRPGVEGLSENITVTSIIGRFLEHARIFHFAAGREDMLEGETYIGSGDWMYRNLNDRVEAVVPIEDPEAKRRVLNIIEVHRADRRNAWDLRADGSYVRRAAPAGAAPDSAEALGTFETMMRSGG
ncbi:MAG: polyphosphate kinase 1 [Phycisphaerales bacterium]